MALIQCPECKKEISDRVKSCPHCGYPLEELTPSGTVRIKFSRLRTPTGFNGNQKASMYSNGKILWEGQVGEVAELHFDGPTSVEIKYHMSMMHYGGMCTGTIDPAKSKKYNVSTRQGVMSTKIVLQPVDVFDSD